MTTLDVKDALHIAQTDRDKWKARAVKLAKILGIRDCDIDSYEQEPCNDAISRVDALQVVENVETARLKGDIDLTYPPTIKGLKALPPVQPKSETVTEFADRCRECGKRYVKRETGKWIKQTLPVKPFGEDTVLCDRCAFMTDSESNYSYCPNCGADMRGDVK